MEAQWGEFYSAESYIILYKYVIKNKEEFVIYFWQGRNSSINEKGTSAYLTVDLDNTVIGGAAVQVRVVQNKEPKHFTALFKGKVIVHKGKPRDGNAIDSTKRLYEVKENHVGVHIVEVECRMDLIHSNSSFILLVPGKICIHHGSFV